jgi:ketosteroid isomerase-like protein
VAISGWPEFEYRMTLAAPGSQEPVTEDAFMDSLLLTGMSVEGYYPDTLMLQSSSFLLRGSRSRAALAVAMLGAVLASPALPAQALPVQGLPAHNGMPRAERHESRHEIYHLENLWRDAVVKGDTTTLGSLLADDYMAITPFGTLQNKQQALDNVGSGRWRVASLTQIERKVRFYGTTALVTSLVEVQGTSPDGDISGDYRYTRVYARDPKGNWKIVSFEANRISPSSAAAQK